ncbi:TetR family transcriptional regulator [Microtetraspora sp. NBRC 13810]|uniref:TetR/AcrR family transcriptional regulator n=1 Tax=Microtetraspora sp. NBRC 13810 TaxID=3030990 RepID=UPI002556853B|nr:TetR/AcrR family transcriptional regulator [Microtetraspora sp. NBRC 13810]GLW08987.1 TetR family transcriptional regulator [Microtetraspora sp. NBRC 13810]
MRVTKGAETSARLVESMLELIQARGYSGTGLNTVVEHARAPKGSLYFHFPQGKEALGEKAVELAAERFRLLVTETALEPGTPGDLIRRVIDVLAGMLADSDYQLGCPVSVVTLEMGAQSERLRDACASAFASWITPMTEYLAAQGHPHATARTLATAVVGSVEGAMIISRAQRSVEPLRCAAHALALLLDREAS